MDETTIRSRQNAAFKRVRAALAGKEAGVLVLEGVRLVRDAVRRGLRLELLLVEERRAAELADLVEDAHDVRRVEDGLLDSLGGVKSAPGVVALCEEPPRVALEDLALDARTRLLVIDGIADPGNLGALARSAEALGVRALVVVRGGARPSSPKALRGSMGSLLRLPVVELDDAAEAARRLAALGVRSVVAATRGGADPETYAWHGPLALWVTSETGGATPPELAADALTLRTEGDAESLNVTVAASLLLDAARRGVGA